MKKVRNISVLMILGLVLLAMTACGGGNSESESKPSRDGFDATTNEELEIGGMIFSVPDYCDFQEQEGDVWESMLETDRGMISISASDSNLSEEEFKEKKVDLIKEWNEKIECETTGDDGSFATTNDSGVNITGKSEMIFNSDNGKLFILYLMQSENAEYDYMSDFNAIIASAHKAENSTNSDSNNEKHKSGDEDRAETDISPEFKATMDSYEEFFDEYVEFMQKYNENPTDTEMLMELSNMMTKEADMLKKLEAMDQSEMTTAEAAYYLEVTARINSKLATVIQ